MGLKTATPNTKAASPWPIAIALSIAVFVMQSDPSLASQSYRESLAMAMVTDAMMDYDKNGEKSFVNFDYGLKFHNGELYVFVIKKGTYEIVAHGGHPEWIDTLTSDQIDPNGLNIGYLLDNNATPEGTWVNYKISDPKTGNIESKTSWIVLHKGYIFGVGVYTP